MANSNFPFKYGSSPFAWALYHTPFDEDRACPVGTERRVRVSKSEIPGSTSKFSQAYYYLEFLNEHVIISSYPFQYVLIIEHRNHHPSIGFYDQHCVPGLVFL